MKITKVRPPKFRVGRNILNEYELRNLMLEVCNGERPAGIVVKDEKGFTATIQYDGGLSDNLFGLALMSGYTLAMIRVRRIKQPIKRVT